MMTEKSCTLCPRQCRAERIGGQRGFCGADGTLRIARAALHHWEEPCISGDPEDVRGSGTIFFTGCPLGCCFCQNYRISHEAFGAPISEERLEEICLRLQAEGAYNINFVTGTPYTDAILRVLDRIRGTALTIPIVWNSGGYERIETLRRLEGYVDIYLPDLKYADPGRAKRYSDAADYPDTAMAAIIEMQRQTGGPVFDADGMLQKGTVVRHLVMPGGRHDSFAVVDRLRAQFAPDDILVSLMAQYTPFYKSKEHPELNRRITTFEYRSVCDRVMEAGFGGYFQEKSAAREEYTPPFDFEGV